MAELDKKDQGGGTHSEEIGGGTAAEEGDEEEADVADHKTGEFFQLEEEGFRAYQGRRRHSARPYTAFRLRTRPRSWFHS